MVKLVLDSYKKFRNGKKKSFKDWLTDTKTSHKVVLLILILTGTFSIAMIFLWAKYKEIICIITSLVGLGVLIGCDIFLVLTISKEELETSSDALTKQYDYYNDVLQWLKSIEYCQKNQIKQLCYHCKKIIEKEELEKEKAKKSVDKIFAIFIAPAWLAIISWTLELDGEANEHFMLIVVLVLLACSIYIVIKCITNEVLEFIYSYKNDLQRMENDLQGVLNRCFEIEDNDIVK